MTEMIDMIEDLNEAANLSNDECGEWWASLASLWPRVRDAASTEFLRAYEVEVMCEHAHLKAHFEIVETTRTHTVTDQTLEMR